MIYSFASANDEFAIKQLLTDNNLVHDDISADQLKHFRLGWDGSRLVAVIGLEIKGRNALLRSLAVEANYRNRNIATRLVEEIEDYAGSLGVNALYLLTMTAADFFKRCGYRSTARESAPVEIQETAEFQNLCPASATGMVKHINEQ